MTTTRQNSIPATLQNTLIVIDAAVEDAQTLMYGMTPEVAILDLDRDRDGVDQITAHLQRHPHITHLHILAQGAPGTLYLGNSHLGLDTLDRYAWDLHTWFSHAGFTTPSLVLYGSQVALGDAGAELLEKLHYLTQAQISASSQSMA